MRQTVRAPIKILACIVFGLGLASCGGGGGGGGGSSHATPVEFFVELGAIPSPSSGDVLIPFILINPEENGSDDATIIVQYSTSGGPFDSATVVGQTSGLGGTPEGTPQSITWKSGDDLPATTASVRIRILTINDSDTSEPFDVAN